MQVFINSGSKKNAITPEYALKLDLKVCHTNIKAQKIDSFTLKTFKIVLASFQVEDKLKRAQYFQEIFLLANIGLKVVLKIFFAIVANADVLFLK